MFSNATIFGLLLVSETTGLGRGFTDKLLMPALSQLEKLAQAGSVDPRGRESDITTLIRKFKKYRESTIETLPWYYPRPPIDGERAPFKIELTPEEVLDVKRGARNAKHAGFTEAPVPTSILGQGY